MYMTYKELCNKIFSSEGYAFVQSGDFHILGKNISIIKNDLDLKECILGLYENDDIYYISIPYRHAKIWCKAIRRYNPISHVIYCDYMDKKDGMIINSMRDKNKYKYLFNLYYLLTKQRNLNIVNYNGKIYLTKLV